MASRSSGLLALIILRERSRRLSTVSRSLRQSSAVMVSMSATGLTRFSTWMTLGSSKQRTTWRIASTSRMWERNWLPSPSPFEAPRTRPAMSTKLDGGGHHLGGLKSFDQRVEPLVGDGDDADVGLDGAERVVLGLGLGAGERVEQGAFADVGQTDDSACEAHGRRAPYHAGGAFSRRASAFSLARKVRASSGVSRSISTAFSISSAGWQGAGSGRRRGRRDRAAPCPPARAPRGRVPAARGERAARFERGQDGLGAREDAPRAARRGARPRRRSSGSRGRATSLWRKTTSSPCSRADDRVVGDAGAVLRELGELVVVRREQRAAADRVVEVLGDGPRDREAVVGARAAADLVEDHERAPRGVAQDVAVSRISTMKVLSPRATLSLAPTRESMRSTTPMRARSRGHEAAHLREDRPMSATWRMSVDLPAMLGPVIEPEALARRGRAWRRWARSGPPRRSARRPGGARRRCRCASLASTSGRT